MPCCVSFTIISINKYGFGFAVPSIVNSVTVLSTTTGTASLQWMEVNGTEDVSYHIAWLPSDAGGNKRVNDTNVVVIDNLKSNTKYTFRVQASNGGGSGQMSKSTSFPTSKHFLKLLL